jgi:glycerophosphoryl diester phosphodiesterase
MQQLAGRAALVCAALLIAVKAAALTLDPASLSPRVLPNLWLALVLLALVGVGRRALRAPRGAPRRRGALLAGLFIGGLTTAHVAVIAWVDHNLARRANTGVYDQPYKVWSNRGLVLETNEILRDGKHNSIESVTLAFDRGAKGVEVDVFYDSELAMFIASHDRPYHLQNGRLLSLRELLAAVGQRGEFWLDWKKLGHLDAAEVEAARAELEELTAPGGLKQRFYIEGEDPLNLGFFRRAGFKTIFDTRPQKDASVITTLLVDLYKAVYYFGGHTVMGMNTGTADAPIYGPETRRLLRNVPLFLYHAPDDAAFLAELLANPDVRVILVQDHSLVRYGLLAPAPTMR